jgi:hypothetical protein
MCVSAISDITKPISNPIKKVTGQSTSKSRAKSTKAVQEVAKARSTALAKSKAKAREEKTTRTRSQQIAAFGANVATGGAKRAASTGR